MVPREPGGGSPSHTPRWLPDSHGEAEETARVMLGSIPGSCRSLGSGAWRSVADRGSVAARGPLVAICMATYEPDPEMLRRQIDSIRAQTHRHWICLISDDGSVPGRWQRSSGWSATTLGSRSRVAAANRGFYANFERALAMVPPEAELVALSDQDDDWYPEKLERLIAGLRARGALVFSDMRITNRAGRDLADTYWGTAASTTPTSARWSSPTPSPGPPLCSGRTCSTTCCRSRRGTAPPTTITGSRRWRWRWARSATSTGRSTTTSSTGGRRSASSGQRRGPLQRPARRPRSVSPAGVRPPLPLGWRAPLLPHLLPPLPRGDRAAGPARRSHRPREAGGDRDAARPAARS